MLVYATSSRPAANITQAIEKGVYSQLLLDRLQELEKEFQVLEGELGYLRIKKPEFTEEQILFMLTQYLQPKEDESEQAFHKRLISCFVSEVYLYNDRIIVFFNISGPDGHLKSTDLQSLNARNQRGFKPQGFDQGPICSTTEKAVPKGTAFSMIFAFGD